MVVVEGVPRSLASEITNRLSIPTIGIGAGSSCDGQILVTHDMLGLFAGFTPKFVRKYANLAEIIQAGVRSYIDDVRNRSFPGMQKVTNKGCAVWTYRDVSGIVAM